MAGNGDRGGLLSAGGILSIIVGICQVVTGAMLIAVTTFMMDLWHLNVPYFPEMGEMLPVATAATTLLIVGIIVVALGILAIIGGISALKRSSFGMALTGAICAFVTLNLPGLLALVFVSLGSGEFQTEEI